MIPGSPPFMYFQKLWNLMMLLLCFATDNPKDSGFLRHLKLYSEREEESELGVPFSFSFLSLKVSLSLSKFLIEPVRPEG